MLLIWVVGSWSNYFLFIYRLLKKLDQLDQCRKSSSNQPGGLKNQLKNLDHKLGPVRKILDRCNIVATQLLTKKRVISWVYPSLKSMFDFKDWFYSERRHAKLSVPLDSYAYDFFRSLTIYCMFRFDIDFMRFDMHANIACTGVELRNSMYISIFSRIIFATWHFPIDPTGARHFSCFVSLWHRSPQCHSRLYILNFLPFDRLCHNSGRCHTRLSNASLFLLAHTLRIYRNVFYADPLAHGPISRRQ